MVQEEKFDQEKFDAEILKLKEKIDPQNMKLENIKDIVYLGTKFFDLKVLEMVDLFQKSMS